MCLRSILVVIASWPSWVAASTSSAADTTQIISTLVLTLTLVVLIVSFSNAHRPQVGITRCDAKYDNDKRDLVLTFRIRNSGNVPAQKLSTSSRIFHHSETLNERDGEAQMVLFPGQETSGNATFHNVGRDTSKLFVHYTIDYQQSVVPGFTRRFRTYQKFEYYPESQSVGIVGGSAT